MMVNPYILALWQSFDAWMFGVGLLFGLLCFILFRLDRAPDATFKFHDFFTAGDWDGKASIARFCYFGGFLTHSLVVMHQEFKAVLSTEAMTWYALIWSGAYVALRAVERMTKTSAPQPTQPTQGA